MKTSKSTAVAFVVAAACSGAPGTTPPTAPTPPAPTPSGQEPAAAPSSSRCPSTPRVIAAEQDAPGLIAVDAESVYWTNQNGGQVMTATLDGGLPRALAEQQQQPFAIAVDATHVYWANNVAKVGSVMRVPKQGGEPEVVADAQDMPYGLALGEGALYWVNAVDGTVAGASLDGRDRKVLATNQQDPTSIATDGRSVFWLYTKAGVELRKLAVAGGTPTTLVVEHGNPRNLVVDRSRVYWTNPYRGAVMSAPTDGGDATELVIDELFPLELAVDATHVYWVDHDRGDPMSPPRRIRRASRGGGGAATVVAANDALGIAVDAHCVYWTEARGKTGAVMAVAK
jgi:hypothetical protein